MSDEPKAVEVNGLEKVLEAQRAIGQRLAEPIKMGKDFFPFVILKDGNGNEQVESLEDVLVDTVHPARIIRRAEFHEMLSFIAYLAEFAFPKTRIYADSTITPPVFRAIIDDHESNKKPNREKHLAEMPLPLSDEWEAWTGLEKGGLVDQLILAEFLKENFVDVRNPDPATLTRMVLELRLKSDVEYVESRNLTSGEVEFKFVEHFGGGTPDSPGKLTLPEDFKINIPVFRGTEPVDIDVALRYRLNSGAVKFCIKIHRKKAIRDAVFKAIAATLAEKTGKPVYLGKV